MEIEMYDPHQSSGETRIKYEFPAGLFDAQERIEKLIAEGKPVPRSNFARKIDQLRHIEGWHARRMTSWSLFKTPKTG